MSRKTFTFSVHHNEYGPQDPVGAESSLHALAKVEARYRENNDWMDNDIEPSPAAIFMSHITVKRER